jgi:hypothetical protein
MINVAFTSDEMGGTRMDLILALKEVTYALETGLNNENTDRQYLAEDVLRALNDILDQTVSVAQ